MPSHHLVSAGRATTLPQAVAFSRATPLAVAPRDADLRGRPLPLPFAPQANEGAAPPQPARVAEPAPPQRLLRRVPPPRLSADSVAGGVGAEDEVCATAWVLHDYTAPQPVADEAATPSPLQRALQPWLQGGRPDYDVPSPRRWRVPTESSAGDAFAQPVGVELRPYGAVSELAWPGHPSPGRFRPASWYASHDALGQAHSDRNDGPEHVGTDGRRLFSAFSSDDEAAPEARSERRTSGAAGARRPADAPRDALRARVRSWTSSLRFAGSSSHACSEGDAASSAGPTRARPA